MIVKDIGMKLKVFGSNALYESIAKPLGIDYMNQSLEAWGLIPTQMAWGFIPEGVFIKRNGSQRNTGYQSPDLWGLMSMVLGFVLSRGGGGQVH